jgi:hypothetical protein
MQSGSPTRLKTRLPRVKHILQKWIIWRLAVSAAVNNTLVTGIQRPVFDYNLVITDGNAYRPGRKDGRLFQLWHLRLKTFNVWRPVRPSTDRATGGSTESSGWRSTNRAESGHAINRRR